MLLWRAIWVISAVMFAGVELAEVKRDYYQVLGVDRKATTREIKKAFRKQAAKYHPDKNKDPGSEETFKEINEAHEVLSNEEKRRRYDTFGHESQPGAGPSWQEGPAGQGGFTFTFDEDMFHNFFGQKFGGEKPFHFNQQESYGRQAHQGHQHHNFFSFNDLFEEDDFQQRTFGDFFGERDPHSFGSGSSFFGSHYGGGRHHGHHEPHAYHQQARWGHAAHTGTRCKTVTQRIGNTVTTYTQCS